MDKTPSRAKRLLPMPLLQHHNPSYDTVSIHSTGADGNNETRRPAKTILDVERLTIVATTDHSSIISWLFLLSVSL
jgi:hypothetical protein